MKKVDLNVDIGEGFPYDEALLEFATSANVCCGEHAGSPELTLQTVEICRDHGVRMGAHPGFPDRKNFGRRTPKKTEIDAYAKSVAQQIVTASSWAEYFKPHGALYNLASARGSSSSVFITSSATVITGVIVTNLPVMLLAGAPITAYLRAKGMPFISEGFADRRYMPNSTLVPRTEPGAVLEDPGEIKRQVLELAPKVDSICLHGDTPGCLEFAEMVRKTLEDAGYEVGY